MKEKFIYTIVIIGAGFLVELAWPGHGEKTIFAALGWTILFEVLDRRKI